MKTWQEERRDTRRAWLVVLAGVAAALHVGKPSGALPVLSAELGLSLVQAGFLLSMVQLAGMLLGLTVGLMADALGLRRSLLTGLLLLALASLLGGWATEVPVLLGLRAIEGVGFLLVAMPAPGLIRRLVPGPRLSAMMGVWGSYMPVGTALALLCGPWMVWMSGWSSWWWALAALTAGVAVWVARGVPPDPQALQWSRAATQGAGGLRSWRARLFQVLSRPGPWLVAISFAMYSSQWLAVVGFLPTVYAQAGLSAGWTGGLTALVAAVNMIGNLASGRMLQHGVAPRRLLLIGFAAMAVGAIGAFAGGDMLTDTGQTADMLRRYLAVLLFSTLGGMVPATLFTMAMRVAPAEDTVSTVVGWVQQWSSIGQFGGPPLVAWVAAVAGGWQWTWVVTAGLSMLGMMLTFRLGQGGRPS